MGNSEVHGLDLNFSYDVKMLRNKRRIKYSSFP